MAYPYQLSDLRSKVQAAILEYSSTIFPDAEIDRALNDGQMDVAAKGLCIERTVGWITDPSTRTLDLTTTIYVTADDGWTYLTDPSGAYIVVDAYYIDVIKVLGIEYKPTSGTRTALLPITPQQLGHVAVKGVEPEFFFRWGKYVGAEPKPAAIAYQMDIHVAQAPVALMEAATPLPEVPQAYVLLLVDYAIFRCLLKLRKFAIALAVYNHYTDKLRELRKTVTNKYPNMAEDTLIPDKVQRQ
jgi:hypothetical protein